MVPCRLFKYTVHVPLGGVAAIAVAETGGTLGGDSSCTMTSSVLTFCSKSSLGPTLPETSWSGISPAAATAPSTRSAKSSVSAAAESMEDSLEVRDKHEPEKKNIFLKKRLGSVSYNFQLWRNLEE